MKTLASVLCFPALPPLQAAQLRGASGNRFFLAGGVCAPADMWATDFSQVLGYAEHGDPRRV